MHYLIVFAGAGLGGALRHAVNLAVVRGLGGALPLATLAVNVIGSLVMGLLFGWLARGGGCETWRLLVGVGLLPLAERFSVYGKVVPARRSGTRSWITCTMSAASRTRSTVSSGITRSPPR